MSRLLRRVASRLAFRFTAVVACGLACVITGLGLRIVVNEEQDLRTAVQNEMLLLTRSVEVAFENALRDRQLADVKAILTALEAIDPRTDLHVIGPKGQIVAQSHGALPLIEVPNDSKVHFRMRPGGEVAATHVELEGPVAGIDGLVLTRPLDDLRADLHRTRVQVAWTVLASILVVTLLLLFVSRRFVELPLARMVDAMRRFRVDRTLTLEGPFTTDEVGDALREFSALATELRAAKESLDREQDERARLELHLQQLDKLATVGQLSASLAHEVGSPLQVLEGRLKSLERSVLNDERAHRMLTIALEQTQRITRVVAQLLAFARPSPAVLREVDPRVATRSVVELLEGEARRRGVRIELDLERAQRRVTVDPDHIAQLVLNLVRNALHAAAEGTSIVVTLEPLSKVTGGLRLIVKDKGLGMSDETKSQIFEPFFTTRGESGGTGLGLVVVRSLAHRYNGEVTVSSEEGQGSTFVVDLPILNVSTPPDRIHA